MAIQDLKTSLDLKQDLNIYLKCKQFDNLNLILSVFDNSLQADLTNYDVRLRAMKADNVPLIQEHIGITKSGNVVNIQADAQLTTTAGNTPIELQFIDKSTGEKKATFNLVLVVVASAIAIEASISKATYTLLEELEKKLDQLSDFFEHIGEAIEANTNLINSTNTANETKEALDDSNAIALATKSTLDTSNTNATNTKNALDTLNTTANNTKNALNTVNQTGQTLLNSLEEFEQEHADVTDISNQLASINADLSEKTNDTDNSRTTTDKTVTGAINELNSNKADKTEVNSLATSKADSVTVQALSTQVNSLASGAPKAVSLVSQMTDTTKNYVYTGSESGYIAGNWYYYNGSVWVSGGVYQSTGMADSSITSSMINIELMTKINQGRTARVMPIIWLGGSVAKTSSSITISGKVGFLLTRGINAYITPTTLSLSAGEIAIIRNLDLNTVANYTGGSNLAALILTKDWHYNVTGNDIVIAWGSDNGINTIFDNLDATLGIRLANNSLYNNRYYTLKAVTWYGASTSSVSKTSSNIKINGVVGFIYNGHQLNVAQGMYELSLGQFLVLRGYSYTTNATITPIIVSYTSVLADDFIIAYRDGLGLWTAWDSQIIESTSYAPQSKLDSSFYISVNNNDLITRSYPILAQEILSKAENINVLFVGDSIFATSGAWVHDIYDETKRFTSLLTTPSAEPLGLTNNILSRKVYEELIAQALNIPIYRRFDYGHTFDYNSASNTYGQDITTLGSAFFAETGEFHTYISSDGNKGSDSLYNSHIPMTKADFNLQSYPYANWYNSVAIEGFTRVSNTADASIQFIVPAGYKKCRIKLRLSIDGDTLTTTLTNCTGASSINTQYIVTGNNNSTFKDYEFTITDTTQTASITLTKSSDTSKLLLYWGCYYYNEPSILVNNMAYGGTKTIKNLDVLQDNLNSISTTYDLIIWELMLLNDYYNSSYTGADADYTTALNAISSYADIIKSMNTIAIIPHKGTLYNDVKAIELWNKAKQILISKNIPFIDLNAAERQIIDYFNNDYIQMRNYMYADNFVHPNTNGVNILKRPIQATLQCNQYNKI